MSNLFRKRLEDGLTGIEASLKMKGVIKKYDKICQRVGRLIGQYPSVGIKAFSLSLKN